MLSSAVLVRRSSSRSIFICKSGRSITLLISTTDEEVCGGGGRCYGSAIGSRGGWGNCNFFVGRNRRSHFSSGLRGFGLYSRPELSFGAGEVAGTRIICTGSGNKITRPLALPLIASFLPTASSSSSSWYLRLNSASSRSFSSSSSQQQGYFEGKNDKANNNFALSYNNSSPYTSSVAATTTTTTPSTISSSPRLLSSSTYFTGILDIISQFTSNQDSFIVEMGSWTYPNDRKFHFSLIKNLLKCPPNDFELMLLSGQLDSLSNKWSQEQKSICMYYFMRYIISEWDSLGKLCTLDILNGLFKLDFQIQRSDAFYANYEIKYMALYIAANLLDTSLKYDKIYPVLSRILNQINDDKSDALRITETMWLRQKHSKLAKQKWKLDPKYSRIDENYTYLTVLKLKASANLLRSQQESSSTDKSEDKSSIDEQLYLPEYMMRDFQLRLSTTIRKGDANLLASCTTNLRKLGYYNISSLHPKLQDSILYWFSDISKKSQVFNDDIDFLFNISMMSMKQHEVRSNNYNNSSNNKINTNSHSSSSFIKHKVAKFQKLLLSDAFLLDGNRNSSYLTKLFGIEEDENFRVKDVNYGLNMEYATNSNSSSNSNSNSRDFATPNSGKALLLNKIFGNSLKPIFDDRIGTNPSSRDSHQFRQYCLSIYKLVFALNLNEITYPDLLLSVRQLDPEHSVAKSSNFEINSYTILESLLEHLFDVKRMIVVDSIAAIEDNILATLFWLPQIPGLRKYNLKSKQLQKNIQEYLLYFASSAKSNDPKYFGIFLYSLYCLGYKWADFDSVLQVQLQECIKNCFKNCSIRLTAAENSLNNGDFEAQEDTKRLIKCLKHLEVPTGSFKQDIEIVVLEAIDTIIKILGK